MFRDDHEAALARVNALEAELARERSNDAAREHKLAQLEATLAKERARLASAEAELARHRPAPAKRPEPSVESDRTPGAPNVYLGSVIAIGVVLIFCLVGLAKCMSKKAPVPERPVPARFIVKPLPDSISALLPQIRQRGEAMLPGSKLLELEAKGVTEDGALHPEYGELEATFQREASKTAPKVDPSVPIGAAPPEPESLLDDYECVYIVRGPTEWRENVLNEHRMCAVGEMRKYDDPLVPNCTMKSIWARARADGAPSDAIATIRLAKGRWTFEINDQRESHRFSYLDDCE